MRKQPEPVPVAEKTKPSDPNIYIGSGGMAIDLREQEKNLEREGCWSMLQHLSGDAKIKQMEKCNAMP